MLGKECFVLNWASEISEKIWAGERDIDVINDFDKGEYNDFDYSYIEKNDQNKQKNMRIKFW